MPSYAELRVEGTDDLHVICHLLKRHGIDLDPQRPSVSRPRILKSESSAGLEAGIESLIALIPDVISIAEAPTGFVVDADPHIGVTRRWASVRTKLRAAGVDAPEVVPSNGFVGRSQATNVAVGVWLMPDNTRSGTLETFLEDLIQDEDTLIDLAKSAVQQAERLDRRFAEPHRAKAVLHTWLAWQANPGVPYGVGIASHYFRHDSPAALAFVEWFRTLFEM